MNTRSGASSGLKGGLVMAAGGAAWVAFWALADEVDTERLVEGAFFLVAGLFWVVVSGARLWGHAAFSQASLVVTGASRPGGAVEAVLELDAHSPVTLSPGGCVVVLRQGEARWVAAGRGSRRRQVHYAHVEERALEVPEVLDAPLQRRLSFAVPRGLAPSWSSEDHELFTEVVVRLSVAGRPEVALVAPVTVLPEVQP